MRKYLPAGLFGEKTFYILSSGFVSAVGFLKNLVFLKFFDFADLGLINLCQNFIITISLLQFGVVTGSYRLFSYKKESVLARINSSVLSYFIFLTLAVLVVSLAIAGIYSFDIEWYWIVYFAVTGAMSLYANWVNCKLIAQRKIAVLNRANLISAILSFSIVFLAYYIGVAAALLSFFLQSAFLVWFAYANVPSIVPKVSFGGAGRYLRRIISIGFIPYLTTAMNFFNSQAGRWTITVALGTIALGKTSLVVMYTTMVYVFPNALSNLFFPDMISHYEHKRIPEFRLTLRRYFLIMSGYVGLTVVLTVVLGKFLVDLVFPKHLEAMPLVYAIMPSLTFILLTGPITHVFNSARKFKEILIGNIISVVSYLVLLVGYVSAFDVELIGFFIIESISSFLFLAYSAWVFSRMLKRGLFTTFAA